jgi:predicted transposase YbfD/YdcC
MNNIFAECFLPLKDPRIDRTKKHYLLDIIAISICGILSGAENWEEIEDFGKEHENWFKQFLDIPNGIPSHDTISRVFSLLDPQNFQECCWKWLNRIKEILPEGIIAVDGKTIKGSKRKNTNKKAFHILNAWSCANQICLRQIKVDSKTNEITAIPELLKTLYIKGAIITLDAMGAQKNIVDNICKAEADYVIALKGNQGGLYETAKDIFKLQDKNQGLLSIYKAKNDICGDHGRIDERKVEVFSAYQFEEELDKSWSGLNSLIRVTCTRTESTNTKIEQRYYISSLPADNPEAISGAIKSHWQVENCLHWSLDVTFREDNSRIRNKNAATNMSWLRKFALGLLRNEKSLKASIRRKQRKVHSSLEYLYKVFLQD